MSFQWCPINPISIFSRARKNIGHSGLGESKYKPHSIRIGATTVLSMVGYPEENMKEASHWKSSAFESYVRYWLMFVPSGL